MTFRLSDHFDDTDEDFEKQLRLVCNSVEEKQLNPLPPAPDCHYSFWSHEYEVELRTHCGCATCTEWLAGKGSQCMANEDPCFPRLTEKEVNYDQDEA